jgi:hypothetical protein
MPGIGLHNRETIRTVPPPEDTGAFKQRFLACCCRGAAPSLSNACSTYYLLN